MGLSVHPGPTDRPGGAGGSERFLLRTNRTAALVPVVLSALALTGWATGNTLLASVRTDFIPHGAEHGGGVPPHERRDSQPAAGDPPGRRGGHRS